MPCLLALACLSIRLTLYHLSVPRSSYRSVQELLENAIDAVEARRIESSAEARVSIRLQQSSPGFVDLEVKDIGEGMPPTDIPSLCGQIFCSSKRFGAAELAKESAAGRHGGTHGIGLKMTMLNAALRAPDMLTSITTSTNTSLSEGMARQSGQAARRCGMIDLISTTASMETVVWTRLGLASVERAGGHQEQQAGTFHNPAEVLARANPSILVLKQAHKPKPKGLSAGSSIRATIPGKVEHMARFSATYLQCCSAANSLPGPCRVVLPVQAVTGSAAAGSASSEDQSTCFSNGEVDRTGLLAAGTGLAVARDNQLEVQVEAMCVLRPSYGAGDASKSSAGSGGQARAAPVSLATANAMAKQGTLYVRQIAVVRLVNGLPVLLGPCKDGAVRASIFGCASGVGVPAPAAKHQAAASAGAASRGAAHPDSSDGRSSNAVPRAGTKRKRSSNKEARQVRWSRFGLRVRPVDAGPRAESEGQGAKAAAGTRESGATANGVREGGLFDPIESSFSGVLRGTVTDACDRHAAKAASADTLSRRAERRMAATSGLKPGAIPTGTDTALTQARCVDSGEQGFDRASASSAAVGKGSRLPASVPASVPASGSGSGPSIRGRTARQPADILLLVKVLPMQDGGAAAGGTSRDPTSGGKDTQQSEVAPNAAAAAAR